MKEKATLVVFVIIYLIIPILQIYFGSRSTYREPCPALPTVQYYLFIGGFSEILLLVFVLHRLNMKYRGIHDEVTETTTTTTHPDGTTSISIDRSSCRSCLNISIPVSLLVAAMCFIMGHWVFVSYNKVQFTHANEDTFCDRELFRANFALVIASYFVGIFVVILAVVAYKKYF